MRAEWTMVINVGHKKKSLEKENPMSFLFSYGINGDVKTALKEPGYFRVTSQMLRSA